MNQGTKANRSGHSAEQIIAHVLTDHGFQFKHASEKLTDNSDFFRDLDQDHVTRSTAGYIYDLENEHPRCGFFPHST